MPFPKKPEDEKPVKPAPDKSVPPKGPDAPPPEADQAEAGEKPSPESGAKPAASPAPKVKTTAPDRKAEGKGGGTSAPLTPNQGVPDVKPHEEATKAEPEADKQALPKEGNEGKKPAAEQPKGLSSLAVMTKTEAESAAKDPMNNPHVQRLASAVHGLAKIVQDLHAKVGAMPLPGQPQPNAGQVAGQQKPGMPMKPGMGMPAKPGTRGMSPGMPMPTAGKMPAAGMPMQRPGAPNSMNTMGAAGGAAQAMTPALALDQIREMMVIIEAANTGRTPRQAAAMMLSIGFGMTPEVAAKMVAQDAGPEEAMSALSMEDDPDAVMINPEEEELEEGLEEGEEEEIEEEGEPVEEEAKFGSKWPMKKFDAVDDAVKIDEALKALKAERAQVVARLDALTYAADTIVEAWED